ncbi:MAG: glutaminyl-peptide cyclotransferase, partial [Chitinophagaceae bacterium]
MNKYFGALSFVSSLLLFSCSSEEDQTSEAPQQIPVLSYSILQAFPHDTSSFTQGLTFYNGLLYEGTGEYEGKSKLMQVDLLTGKSIAKISLHNKFFGEGITILHDTIYQLTWQN